MTENLKITFVICDDDPEDRNLTARFVRQALEAMGGAAPAHECLFFHNGKVALDWFHKRGHADSVFLLTDYLMPVMDGIYLIDNLNEEGLMPRYCALISSLRKAAVTVKNSQLDHLPILMVLKEDKGKNRFESVNYDELRKFLSDGIADLATSRPNHAIDFKPNGPAPH